MKRTNFDKETEKAYNKLLTDLLLQMGNASDKSPGEMMKIQLALYDFLKGLIQNGYNEGYEDGKKDGIYNNLSKS
jgi:hypothetical protein